MTSTLQAERLAAWRVIALPADAHIEFSVTETLQPPEHDESAALPPFAAIVNEHGPAVYRLAKSVVRDSALADDVAQETFIKVWKHLAEFRGEGCTARMDSRIAHNQAVSTLRRVRDSATDPSRLPDAGRPDHDDTGGRGPHRRRRN